MESRLHPDSRHVSLPRRVALGFVAITLVNGVGYAVYSGDVWEDFLITYRCGWNAAEGKGLVFTEGERVHAFTSPLNTLIPAALHRACGTPGSLDFTAELWGYRLVCLAALAGGGLFGMELLWRGSRRRGRAGLVPPLLFGTWLNLEPKTMMFTMNGQEAGLMALFLLGSLHEIDRPGGGRWWRLAAWWAGLMHTRPDSPVVIAGMSAVWALWPGGLRARTVSTVLRAAAGCAALCLPWVLFATSYYGSPVPQTIVAKALLRSGLANAADVPLDLMAGFVHACGRLFRPTYFHFGGWPSWYLLAGLPATIIAMAAAWHGVEPRFRRLGAMLVTMLLYHGYLVATGVHYPWYWPPVCVVAALAFAGCVGETIVAVDPRLLTHLVRPAVVGGVAAVFTAALALQWAGTWQQSRARQQVVEIGRRDCGVWLRGEVPEAETVYLECLGFIGYYSQRRMQDFPGLCAPDVSHALAELPRKNRTVAEAAVRVGPDWLVLRPGELRELSSLNRGPAYEIVRTFDQRDGLRQVPAGVPGRDWLAYDSVFIVLRRHRP